MHAETMPSSPRQSTYRAIALLAFAASGWVALRAPRTPAPSAMRETLAAPAAPSTPTTQATSAGSGAAVSLPSNPPTEDLLLIGFMEVNSTPCALFEVTAPDRPPVKFTLRPGEANDWLAVRAIDVASDAVTAVLRKPVVRIRAIGVEVILLQRAHARQNGLAAL